MNFAKEFKIVPMLNSADYGSGATSDSINMAKAHRATIIFMFGAISGDAVLTLYSGATAASTDSALTFRYALGSGAIGAASADVLGTEATSAALTLTGSTYQNKMLVVEIEASEMDMANNEEWLTFTLSTAATSGLCEAVAIVYPRYSDGRTVLA